MRFWGDGFEIRGGPGRAPGHYFLSAKIGKLSLSRVTGPKLSSVNLGSFKTTRTSAGRLSRYNIEHISLRDTSFHCVKLPLIIHSLNWTPDSTNSSLARGIPEVRQALKAVSLRSPLLHRIHVSPHLSQTNSSTAEPALTDTEYASTSQNH